MSTLGTVAGTLGDLATGNVGGLVSGAASTAANLVLKGVSSWVLTGTKDALTEISSVIGTTTAPNLESTWFSATYWRVAALAAMLTIPFLCAAAVQAMARGDLGLLAQAAFGYLPLSVLGVSLAAPLTMLLLAATDQMSAVVSANAATGGAHFLDHAAQVAGALGVAGGSPFFAVIVGLLTVMAALALGIELLIRAAAVYVVVLLLPLAFAAMVWPARRVWASRLVELLVSLILSKFVIVAVLSLAAAAFVGGTPGVGELLVAMSLLLLSTFAPWALMRILPFTELAAGAAGIIGAERSRVSDHTGRAASRSAGFSDLATQLPARLREHARLMQSEPGDDSAGVYAATGLTTARSAPTQPEPAEPPVGSAVPGGLPTDSAPSGAPAQDQRPPFVLPDAWQRSEPLRLDGDLLRPPAEGADDVEDQP